jgi:hypothetical protein
MGRPSDPSSGYRSCTDVGVDDGAVDILAASRFVLGLHEGEHEPRGVTARPSRCRAVGPIQVTIDATVALTGRRGERHRILPRRPLEHRPAVGTIEDHCLAAVDRLGMCSKGGRIRYGRIGEGDHH